MILGTAGHIDHGKTALVRALTGVDTDRLPEEKRRGITIDLGFAPLALDSGEIVGIVDVPGHEAFVRTMLAGSSGIDVALLVVAADEGVMPQTREHLAILDLLGVSRIIVALTKRDLVEDEWLELVSEDVSNLVHQTSLELAGVFPVSSVTRSGLSELRLAIARASSETANRTVVRDLFRMPVDRAFSVKGTGTVVTGTVWSGAVLRDSIVIVQPTGEASRVRAIQCHDRPVECAEAGMRAAIALADCQVSAVPRGCVIVADAAWVPTRELETRLSLVDEFMPTPRTRVRVHIGTSDTDARFAALGKENGVVLARLILDEPLVSRAGDRFVMRLPSPARTIGGGTVIDPYPPSRKHRRSRRHPALGRSNGMRQLLENAGTDGVELQVIPLRTGLSPAAARIALDELDAVIAGDRAFLRETLLTIEASIENAILTAMANHPLEAGVSLQTVRANISAPSEVVDLALSRLQEGQRIELAGSLAKPFGWTSRLDQRAQELSDAILHEICIRAAEPPSVGDLAARFGGTTLAMLRRLERAGEIERVSEDRYYAREAVEQMFKELRSTLVAGKVYSPAE
ncbi:MAG TPA: selenocysteine-specific translation elongation factor, partial [Gemmatimonadaceae bacterium]|nr:selenocysteine-specific translation elongation factor [Gemmatimonadaceae bacterium]